MSSKKKILPWYVTEDKFPVDAGILCSLQSSQLAHRAFAIKKKTTRDVLYARAALKLISFLAISNPSKKREAIKNNAKG